jgi:hypothetical protein
MIDVSQEITAQELANKNPTYKALSLFSGAGGLKEFFDEHNQVHAGVCSLQLTPGAAPWIVCPRK